MLGAALTLVACEREPAGAPETTPEAAAADVSRVAAVLTPVRANSGSVTAVDVSYDVTGTVPNADNFSVQAPIVYAGRTDMADSVTGIAVRDAEGAVPLTVEDDPDDPSGFPYFRHWRAARPVAPPVTVSYRVDPQEDPTPGPQFDFYSHDGGFSAAGMALFVLPEEIGTVAWQARWSLGQLVDGAFAASTYGDGDFEVEGDTESVLQAYYMVGPLGRYDAPDDGSSFHGYWLGQPKFEAANELAWVADAYAYLRDFFQDEETSSYRVFLRALAGTRGGTALGNSFMLAVEPGDADPDVQSPRGTMFHEMGHMFVGNLEGEEIGGSPWFAEGLNVYYTRLLMLRSGLAPVSDYVESINSTARNYYSNKYRSESAAELDRLGFSTGVGTGSAQNVPYTRGSLYFATVDSRIRAASDGTRNLDHVILPLFERRRNGEALTPDALVEALVDELGPSARVEFEAIIIDGELVVPPSNAFGPCLERRPAVFELDDGAEFDGYEWVRVDSVADAECREI